MGQIERGARAWRAIRFPIAGKADPPEADCNVWHDHLQRGSDFTSMKNRDEKPKMSRSCESSRAKQHLLG